MGIPLDAPLTKHSVVYTLPMLTIKEDKGERATYLPNEMDLTRKKNWKQGKDKNREAVMVGNKCRFFFFVKSSLKPLNASAIRLKEVEQLLKSTRRMLASSLFCFLIGLQSCRHVI